MIDLKNRTIDIDYMQKIFSVCKDEPGKEQDIYDSLGPNQFISKTELITTLKEFGVLNKNMTVIVIGSWYGSIIIPTIAPLVKRVECVDIDEYAVRISRRFFEGEYPNVNWWTRDFTQTGETHEMFLENDILIINTSCEHMIPMKQFWDNVRPPHKKDLDNVWFACQSNDMVGIEGHVNCVHTTAEFEKQMPKRLKIYHKDKIIEPRGTRFFIFGRLRPEEKPTLADTTTIKSIG
jgi:hypothetical protein